MDRVRGAGIETRRMTISDGQSEESKQQLLPVSVAFDRGLAMLEMQETVVHGQRSPGVPVSPATDV